MAGAGITPVTVLTAFLGSGKSTLLARILRDPRYADRAGVVNEWGEVPIDHALLREAGRNRSPGTTSNRRRRTRAAGGPRRAAHAVSFRTARRLALADRSTRLVFIGSGLEESAVIPILESFRAPASLPR